MGRSISSDQNFAGLPDGDVICARAIVRLVPSVRWNMDIIAAIKVNPLEFRAGHMDSIEEDPDPHAHPEPKPMKQDGKAPKRLKIFDSDIKNFGYTEGCPRCDVAKKGQMIRARGVRHSEECRQRIDEQMREAGVVKLKRADLENSPRTRTQTRDKKAEAPAQLDDATMEPLEPLDDAATPKVVDNSEPANDNVDMLDDFDTSNFYQEVDE